ncbi:metal ABC transporter substrate-binding protein [Ruminiclostridium herbifermentans]|uniref:Lipoprotein n=1 Tax=Ruminiclostridium herbifermentans TaxID=2488810 RepID=A0A4U7JKU9_9FIRM|nr:MetQ/NlpA family ABC transporter substrate-binding protein [Ruminiclostridium herbifermentans]QNU68640.1 metal ABC transporter substrate-binding protein [Ruminiclostridium herbifermentans]
MKKILRISSAIILTLALGLDAVSCGNSNDNKEATNSTKQQAKSSDSQNAENKEIKEIVFGVAPGPYGDMAKLAIQPELEKKGYTVKLIEFSDYVQPNLALGNGEVNVNMFQHSVYLENFAKEHKLELSRVISIPTAGMGIFSKKHKTLSELPEGAVVTLPNDVPNLARALRFLVQENLITLKPDIDLTKASEKDIAENPKKLKFTPAEAAQLPRTLESADIAIINGNYAISSGLSLADAVAKEKLEEPYKNIIAVRTADKDAQFVKDIEEIVRSEAFRTVILDSKNIFKDFDFPEWFK